MTNHQRKAVASLFSAANVNRFFRDNDAVLRLLSAVVSAL
jgi:hypothetical protein